MSLGHVIYLPYELDICMESWFEHEDVMVAINVSHMLLGNKCTLHPKVGAFILMSILYLKKLPS